MLQAVVAIPAELEVAPNPLILSHATPTAELVLSGPHVLSWTASTDQAWELVSPSSGVLPASPTVTLDIENMPASDQSAQVLFEASGDVLNRAVTVTLSAQGFRHLSPDVPEGALHSID